MVEFSRNIRRTADGVEGVAEVEPTAGLRVEEWASAHQVAGAPQLSCFGVPQREGIISDQVGETLLAPAAPRAQDQLLIGNGNISIKFVAVLLELAPQIVASVEAYVAEQPHAAIQGTRLRRTLRRGTRVQKRKAKSGAWFGGDACAVGAAERQPLRHALQQARVRRRAIEGNHSGEAAHNVSELWSGKAASKVA